MSDDFGKHEVMDRAWIVSHTFDTFIASSPAVLAIRELTEAAQKLSEALGDFYQLAGKYAMEDENEETTEVT